jgi:hypothetical protein
MPDTAHRSVDITENGRTGSDVHREPAGSLSFYWEFGEGLAPGCYTVVARDGAQVLRTWVVKE